MSEPEPRRPWRTRRRVWAAAAALLLLPLLLYPFAFGPSLYLAVSYDGWPEIHVTAFGPFIDRKNASFLGRAERYDRYCNWWSDRGLRSGLE